MNSFRKFLMVSFITWCGAHGIRADESAIDSKLSIKKESLIQESQLRLPRSYQQHRPTLWKAAALAVQTPGCVRFLVGELHRDLSTPSHPVFRILCRDIEDQSYALLVDGLSMHVLDDTRPGGRVSFKDLQEEIEAERERQRLREAALAEARMTEAKKLEDALLLRQLEEKQRAETQRRKLLWGRCQEQVANKVRNMSGLVWLTQEMPEPDVDDKDKLIFPIDFDAQDLRQQQLKYRAECRVSEIGDLEVLIRPRKVYGT